jgi:SAM-dependent methyltransferase
MHHFLRRFFFLKRYTFGFEFQKALQDCSKILDLGCGDGSPLLALAQKPYSVGVDLFAPSIEKAKKLNIHNEYFQSDVMKIDELFPAKSFDAVMALDLIEHLEKEQGLALLKKMESVARKKIIIFTPNGFLTQGIHFDNPLQEHQSGWTVKEMKKLGFKVIGIGGFKPLRGDLAQIKWKPVFLWTIVSYITQLFTRDVPSLAFSLLCIKEIKS